MKYHLNRRRSMRKVPLLFVMRRRVSLPSFHKEKPLQKVCGNGRGACHAIGLVVHGWLVGWLVQGIHSSWCFFFFFFFFYFNVAIGEEKKYTRKAFLHLNLPKTFFPFSLKEKICLVWRRLLFKNPNVVMWECGNPKGPTVGFYFDTSKIHQSETSLYERIVCPSIHNREKETIPSVK